MGIILFDITDTYGGTSAPTGSGLPEEVIGRCISLGGGRSDFVILATKVHGATVSAFTSDPNRR